METKDCVTIIHFNDCYNIEPSPKSGGAASFLTAIEQQRHLNPMILFSGDIISPSFISTFTRGEQMVPVLNDIKVDCAVFGNHEFDYGVDNLIEFVKKTSFPWLLSNVIDKETSNQLGDGQVFHIIQRSGIKFGLIGLIEEEWLSTLSTLDSSDVIYEDFVVRGRELARWLKSEPHYVDYVIALTHFRTPNDILLADSVPEIDLILGGHDHDYDVIKRPNCYIIKSGTDFREFSKITLKINPDYQKQIDQQNTDQEKCDCLTHDCKPFLDINIERVECLNYEPNKELKLKLDKFITSIDEKMGKVLGQFNCELDGRFSSIRKFETNLGNFVTDIMLASTHADLAILNSGTLRSDRIHPKGNFTMRDLFNILGYIDPIAVLQATGEQIWKALENGVSQWPKLEGRFPQISGCTFTFDPNKPPMQRIDPSSMTIGDEKLILDKQYRLTTKAYLASGKDGYDILRDCKVLVPGDESPDLTTSILNHFEAISIVKSNRRTHHRQSIICLSRSSIQRLLDHTPLLGGTDGTPITPCSHYSETLAEIETNFNPKTIQNTSDDETVLNRNNNGNNSLDHTKASHASDISSPTYKSTTPGRQQRPDYQSPSSNDKNNNGIKTSSSSFGDELLGSAGGYSFRASSPLEGSEAPTPSCMAKIHETNTLAASAGTTPSIIPRQARTKRLMSLYEMEHEQCKLEPKVEGRIRIVGVNT